MANKIEESGTKLTAARDELRAAGFKSAVVFQSPAGAKSPVGYILVAETQEDLDAAQKAMLRSLTLGI